MNAIYLERKAGAESLVSGDLPRPAPQSGEVLVRVHATAVMPTEFAWMPTFNMPAGAARPFPIILSHEFSGEVESVGPEVKGFSAGDEVFGINDWFKNGAQADYCVAAATSLARKPKSIDHVQSAVVPISALTAWQGLTERAKLAKGQRVLIHGAAGGVGTFAVQFARERGAHVVATASSANLDFVREVGAHEVIDYRKTRFQDLVRDMDVVFDGVGGETLESSWSVLKPGGAVVTYATQSGAATARARKAFMLVRADGPQLSDIARMIDTGRLRVFVAAVFPLSEAREAYARAQHGGARGKIALRVID